MLLKLLVLLAVGALFPPLAHKLPVYPEGLERLVFNYYEARDADSSSNVLRQLGDFLTDALPSPVNVGPHFERFLSGKESVKGPMFFEGWYYKAVTEDLQHTMIVIPGVFFDGEAETDHAFIMTSLVRVGDSQEPEVMYHRFELSEVKVKSLPGDKYDLHIADNHFTDSLASLKIQGKVEGKFEVLKAERYPGTWLNPNIMGFFSYIDAAVGMQCVHKVVALDAVITGKMQVKGNVVDFSNGRMYIEGDYGSEFPSKYVWAASNHFADNPGSSVMVSIASIPFPNDDTTLFSFTGGLAFLYDAKTKKTYRFGTYTGVTINVEGFENNKLKDKNEASIVLRYVIKLVQAVSICYG